MLASPGHALLVGVRHDVREVDRLERVQDVEEVRPRWPFPYWVFVWEVGHEDGVLGELRVDVLHRQFIVAWDLDVADLRLLEQLLLARQDRLEEVLVHHRLVWQIELQAK